MPKRPMILCAALTVAAIAATAQAVPVWSWESGTAEDWGWTNDIDTGWQGAQPMWTNKVRSGFGATDGNLAYTFNTPDVTGFGFDEGVRLNASAIVGIDPVQAFRWDTFAANNLMFVDMTVQGQRLAPIDPNAGNYVAFWPALNGPAAAGGFIGSYDNPIDLNTGATSQYQIVFSTEYYEGPRTRTFAWDYVNAGYLFDALAPTNDADNYTFLYWSTNSNTTGLLAAMDNFRLYRARASDPTWSGGAAGTWSSGTWTNGAPNGVGSIAIMKYIAGTPAVAISLDSSKTVGSLLMDSAARSNLGTPLGNASGTPQPSPTVYTIDAVGGASLTFDNGTNEASIVATSAGNAINAPVAFNSDAVIDLTADIRTGNQDGVPGLTGGGLTINGNVTIAAGKTLRTTSVGSLTLNGTVTGGVGSVLRIGGGSTTFSAAASRVHVVGALSVASSAVLDLADNTIIVDYAAGGASPLAGITASIIAGQTGNGIRSGDIAVNEAIGIIEATAGTFAGTSVDGSAVVLRLTLKGDTNLNRIVNFEDLLALAQSYDASGTGKTWANGDSDYSGVVDFNDLLALAQNYNTSLPTNVAALVAAGGDGFAADWALAQSLVPEPTTAGLLGAASLLMTRRRRA